VANQTSVKLAKLGLPDIVATNVAVAAGGASLTCDLNINGAVTGPWDVAVTVSGCSPVTLAGGFLITAGATPAPLTYVEKWDTYSTGTSDPDYIAHWASIPGQIRHTIFTSRPWSSPNSLLVNNNPGGPFGITNDLTDELRAAVPGAVEVIGSDSNALDAIFYVHMSTTSANLKYGDLFIELSKGDVHAPGSASPTVLSVLAFGVTYSINGATKCPYFFDGKNWIQISGATSVTGWNFFKMTVKSNTCLLSEYKTGTYVGTQTRQYTGGFDRVSLRTVNNQGDWRSLDDVYLSGGLIMPMPAPTITGNPANQSVDCGKTATFTVSASGAGTVAYQWQKDSVNINNSGHYAGAGTPTLTVSNADNNVTGDYRCIVSNVGGSVYSNTATLALGAGAPADFDNDCDVDGADFDALANCFSGAEIPFDSGCEEKDLDQDDDVDQTDFGMFQRCYSGEGNPADPNCAN